MAKEKVKKSLFRRWWFWVGAFVIIVIVASTSHGGSSNTNTVATSAPPSSSSTNTTSGSSSSGGSSQTSTQPAPKIGQTVTVGKFTVKVNSISYQSKLDDGGTGMAPGANGGTWLIVNVTIKNNDNQARTLDTSMFTVLKGSTKYEASAEADPFVNNNSSFFLASVNPGLSLTGNMAFNVPAKDSYQLQVDGGMFVSTSSVVIDLNN